MHYTASITKARTTAQHLHVCADANDTKAAI